jgi:hypothetical protein
MYVYRVSECLCVCKWLQYAYSYVIVYTNIILDWPDFSLFPSLSLASGIIYINPYKFSARFFSLLVLRERLSWYMHMYGHVLLHIKKLLLCTCKNKLIFFCLHSNKKKLNGWSNNNLHTHTHTNKDYQNESYVKVIEIIVWYYD